MRTWLLALALSPVIASLAQDANGAQKTEPEYEETFSGPIVELTAEKITLTRSILGKAPEKRSFWIKPETRIEGKLKVKVRVTVGYVTSDDGDVARLIVVRPQKK